MPDAFRVEDLDGGIALVTFDLPDKKVNTLGQAVLRELAGLVGKLRSGPTCAACCSGAASRGSSSPGPTSTTWRCWPTSRPSRRPGAGRRPSDFQRPQPTAVSDRRADRRQLPGRRHRAGAVDGRPAGLCGGAYADRLARGQGRPDPRLGRHAAAAAAGRPEPGDRDDHLGRAGLRRRRPLRSAWSSTPSPPIGWSRRASGGSRTSRRAASGRSAASSSGSRWASTRTR